MVCIADWLQKRSVQKFVSLCTKLKAPFSWLTHYKSAGKMNDKKLQKKCVLSAWEHSGKRK